MPNAALCWIAALGGGVLAGGAFLDSVSASAGRGTLGVSIDQSYIDGDGPIELVLGVAIIAIGALLAFGVLPRWTAWVAAGLGLLGAVIAVADVIDVQNKLDDVEALGGSGSIGPALWVCLAGGVIAAVGGTLTAISSKEPSP